MEPIVIKKGKYEYSFYSDRIVSTKNGKPVYEVFYHEIEEITYNPKFGFKDFLTFLISVGVAFECAPRFLMMRLKTRKISQMNVIGTKLSNKEFEKVKGIISVPIRMV